MAAVTTKALWAAVSWCDAVHVLPVNDLIAHEPDDCVCGPTVEAVPRDDGSMGWLLTHHSLDGREGCE